MCTMGRDSAQVRSGLQVVSRTGCVGARSRRNNCNGDDDLEPGSAGVRAASPRCRLRGDARQGEARRGDGMRMAWVAGLGSKRR
jgi:hypothetical protein